MKRRLFLKSALATSALAAFRQQLAGADAPAAASRGFRLAAGRDRHDQSMRLGGATPTDTKISTADSNGGLYLFEHRHMARGGPPRHFHHEQDEFFHVIEGAFRFEVGDERYELGPGDTVFMPRLVPHAWACVSRTPGTILGAVFPALKFEEFFKVLGARPSPPPPDEAAALFAAYGMEIVGPPLPLEA